MPGTNNTTVLVSGVLTDLNPPGQPSPAPQPGEAFFLLIHDGGEGSPSLDWTMPWNYNPGLLSWPCGDEAFVLDVYQFFTVGPYGNITYPLISGNFQISQ